MTDVVSSVIKYLKVKENNLDNGVFKLFSKGSMILCLFGAAMVMANQYFGSPIECDFDSSISGSLFQQYCWVHGSFWIKKEYQEEFDCRIRAQYKPYDDVSEAPRTEYYQWVVFFLPMQAALFYLPYLLWKHFGAGLLKGFDSAAARSAFTIADEEATDKIVDSFVKNFNVVFHHNTRYFICFVLCEFLNVVILLLNFIMANSFLQGKFAGYGFDVLEYYRTPYDLRTGVHNPMCETFPTKVSCSVKVVAEGGGTNTKNGLCILTQNIVNEKVFLVLYFWYIFLFVVSAFYLVYRVATLVMPQFRERALLARARAGGIHGPLRKVLSQCQVGDWFILNQICKNVDPYFFREFIWQLSDDLGKFQGPRVRRKWPRGAAARAEEDEGNNDGVCLMKFENREQETKA